MGIMTGESFKGDLSVSSGCSGMLDASRKLLYPSKGRKIPFLATVIGMAGP